MDQHQFSNDSSAESSDSRSKLWVVALVIALIGAAALGVGYGFHQQGLVSQMTARDADNSAAMGQMHGQIDSLTAKLNELNAAQQQQQQAAQAAAQPASRSTSASRGRAVGSSKQMKQLQAQLSDQQKQLADTRDTLDKTRS